MSTISKLSSDSRTAIRIATIVPFVIAAIVGVGIGLALAQDRRAGQLDVACATNCTAHGYDPEFCGKVCWLPDPDVAAKAVPVDWVCMTDCLDRGGAFADCKLRCQRR